MHIIVLKYFKQSEISQEKNVLTHKVSHYNNISKFCKVNSSWPWHFIKASNNHSMESYLNIAYLVLWLDTIDKTLWTEHPSLYHCASNYLLWRQLFYSVTSHGPSPAQLPARASNEPSRRLREVIQSQRRTLLGPLLVENMMLNGS